MITDAFDHSEVLFGGKDFYGEQKHLKEKTSATIYKCYIKMVLPQKAVFCKILIILM